MHFSEAKTLPLKVDLLCINGNSRRYRKREHLITFGIIRTLEIVIQIYQPDEKGLTGIKLSQLNKEHIFFSCSIPFFQRHVARDIVFLSERL